MAVCNGVGLESQLRGKYDEVNRSIEDFPDILSLDECVTVQFISLQPLRY